MSICCWEECTSVSPTVLWTPTSFLLRIWASILERAIGQKYLKLPLQEEQEVVLKLDNTSQQHQVQSVINKTSKHP